MNRKTKGLEFKYVSLSKSSGKKVARYNKEVKRGYKKRGNALVGHPSELVSYAKTSDPKMVRKGFGASECYRSGFLILKFEAFIFKQRFRDMF